MIGAGLVAVAVVAWARVLRAARLSQSVFRLGAEALAIQTVVSTLVSVLLVSMGRFRVLTALSLAAAIPLLSLLWPGRARWTGFRGTPLMTRYELTALLLLVLVAPIALPRMELLYMENDAGVYSNRALHHLFEGSLTADVPVRAQLENGSVETFDQDNFHILPRDPWGRYLMGTYVTPEDASRFSFQFYPGWPMLMAQWAGILGPARMFYAPLFTFVMAVLFFGFLLEERGIGGLAFATTLALFASSPLLLYFSKYTTSESFLLFLLLFVLHFLSSGGTGRAAVAALGVLALVVTHISTFLYAPLVLLAALSAYYTADRRMASFGVASFLALLAGIPFGLFCSRWYMLDVYRGSFGSLPGDRPAVAGLALVVAAYVVGLALSLDAWWRVHRGAVPRGFMTPRTTRLLGLAMRTAIVLILVSTVYQGYQLGWTDRFVPESPGGHGWRFRSEYAGAGWPALAHANIVSMCMATSLVGLPMVLFVAIRRGGWMCASRWRVFLLVGVLLCLGIYTFLRFDTSFNYYASRYFIPVFVPCVMLLVGELIHTAPLRRGAVVALVIVGLGFNLRYDVPLYRYPAYTDELRFIEDVAASVGEGRTLFLLNPKRDDREAQRLLVIPLASAHRIPVVNVVSRPDAPVDDQVREYAARLELRDAAVLSRRPPVDDRAFEAIYLVRHRLRQDIWYPHVPAKPLRRRYYLYDATFW